MAFGLTDFEPEESGETGPTPLSMLNEKAFEVVHDNSDGSPVCMEVGLADRVQVGGGGPEGGTDVRTFTVAVHIAEPPAPLTVPV